VKDLGGAVIDTAASDRDLVRRVLSGREEAFAEFFDGHFPRLYRFALVRVNHDPDAAEEVAQAVLCRAIAKLRTYRGEAMLFTWLCTFCRHEIAEWHRRRGRAHPVDLAEDSPEIRGVLESLAAGMGGGPEDELQRKEVARWVQVTLDGLPHPYGDTLEWKYLQGHSVREIAARLRVSPKAAESLLTRARRAFREAFSALVGDSWRPGSSRA
jgi:RNA polymerase sigma-70 factor, ECF subfamily